MNSKELGIHIQRWKERQSQSYKPLWQKKRDYQPSILNHFKLRYNISDDKAIFSILRRLAKGYKIKICG